MMPVTDCPSMQVCTGCGRELPLDAYHRSRNHRNGRVTRCRECRAAYGAAHRAERAAASATYNATHRAEIAAYNLSRYGITPEDFDAILAEQGGGCGICGTTDQSRRRFDLDHDHGHCPGRFGCPICIRGVLCNPCNVRLRHVENQKIVRYLARATRRQEAA